MRRTPELRHLRDVDWKIRVSLQELDEKLLS